MAPEDFPVFPASFLPGVVTHRFHDTWAFYTELLGFRTQAERHGYVRLLHPSGALLQLIQAERGDTPEELVAATSGRGWWLTLEVADVGRARAELLAQGVELDPLPEGLRWHEEAVALRDPNGILVVIARRPSLVRSHSLVREPCRSGLI